MKIGGYQVKNILAPMAGYTDIAFRTLAREHGADFTVTEMVSTRGLVHGGAATRALMALSDTEKPSCIQLFGSDPADFAESARLINSDIIDINMGCPMPKIVKNGDGAALMKNIPLAAAIVKAVRAVTDRPITVKTRLGYDIGKDTAAALISAVAAEGADAVTVHGRYAAQRYEGRSDLDAIKKLKDGAPVPVIPSGDITRENIAAVISEFGAAMVGRAALGDIGLFTGERVSPVPLARRHIALLKAHFDDRYTVAAARKFFVHYFKSVRGGRALRVKVNSANSAAEIERLLDAFDADELD